MYICSDNNQQNAKKQLHTHHGGASAREMFIEGVLFLFSPRLIDNISHCAEVQKINYYPKKGDFFVLFLADTVNNCR